MLEYYRKSNHVTFLQKLPTLFILIFLKKDSRKPILRKKWCILANPNSIVRLQGKLLYVHDTGYARVETLHKNTVLRMSIPIVSPKIMDIMRVETHNNIVYLKCNDNTHTLHFHINSTVTLDLHWLPSQGLEGFRFEWIQPHVSSWLSLCT